MAKKLVSVAALWLALAALVFIYTDRDEYTWRYDLGSLDGARHSVLTTGQSHFCADAYHNQLSQSHIDNHIRRLRVCAFFRQKQIKPCRLIFHLCCSEITEHREMRLSPEQKSAFQPLTTWTTCSPKSKSPTAS